MYPFVYSFNEAEYYEMKTSGNIGIAIKQVISKFITLYLVMQLEEQEPSTKLVIPESDINLSSDIAGLSPSSSTVAIYKYISAFTLLKFINLG